jgi:hypothetical protein
MKAAQNAVLVFLTLGILCLAGLAVLFSRHPDHGHYGKRTVSQGQSEQDKSFWERATADPVAAFTLALVIIAAGQATLFIWQLGLIREAATDAQKAASLAGRQAVLAERTLILSQRPWLSVEVYPCGEYLAGGKDAERYAQVMVGVKIRNHGKSPAVAVGFVVRFVDDNETAAKEALIYVRASSKAQTSMAGTDTMPVFPDREETICTNASKPTHGNYVLGYIVGCVSYDFPFGEGRGQTTFCHTLAKRTPSKMNLAEGYGIHSSETVVAAADLIYQRFPKGNNAT